MKTKARILVVEDNAIIYKRLKMTLLENNYEVYDYTPSVKKALEQINLKRPDLVLLDIDLQGGQTGLDLGKMLSTDYQIPFIYVTDFDDDYTFFEGLSTQHEQFIVKTKPQLEVKEVIRAIQTVLNRAKPEELIIAKEGILGLVNYLDVVKNYGAGTVSKVPVKFEEIAFFTVKPFINKSNIEERLRANYLWFKTVNNKRYLLKKSLKELQACLPHYFVRINESYIVNISAEVLKGRINGTRLSILDQEFLIKDTYKKEFNKRMEELYQV